jgi:hypothetical protein
LVGLSVDVDGLTAHRLATGDWGLGSGVACMCSTATPVPPGAPGSSRALLGASRKTENIRREPPPSTRALFRKLSAFDRTRRARSSGAFLHAPLRHLDSQSGAPTSCVTSIRFPRPPPPPSLCASTEKGRVAPTSGVGISGDLVVQRKDRSADSHTSAPDWPSASLSHSVIYWPFTGIGQIKSGNMPNILVLARFSTGDSELRF